MTKNFVRIDGWPVAPAVARDYLRMRAAHDADTGVSLRINSGYRTRSEQAAIFTARYRRGAYSPYGDYRVYQGATWGRVSGLGPVASPDVGSNHTRGYALDLSVTSGSVSQSWLLAHGDEYGFNWVEGQSVAEPWHWCWYVGIAPNASSPDPWEGRGAPDPVYPSDPGIPISDILAGGGSGHGGTTTTPSEEDDDMKYIKNSDTGQIYAIAPEYIKHIDGPDGENKAWVDAGYPDAKALGKWSFARILRIHGIPSNVVNGKGNVLDDLNGQGKYVKHGSWSRAQKAERLAFVAGKK